MIDAVAPYKTMRGQASPPSILLSGNVIRRRNCDGCGKLLIKPHPIVYTPEDGKIYCGGQCKGLT